ncbi:MAG: hypothetical protein HY301_10950 [Verrucomicrobia bacterium]|nr:hypothetical protein [Verrucomicrobiota bacterium]
MKTTSNNMKNVMILPTLPALPPPETKTRPARHASFAKLHAEDWVFLTLMAASFAGIVTSAIWGWR